MDAPICGRDQLSFGLPVVIRIIAAEIALLTPAIARGFDLTDFMNKPPRLHNTAVKTRENIAFGLSFTVSFILKLYHRLLEFALQRIYNPYKV